MNKILRLYRAYRLKRSERILAARQREISESFQVAERGGKLWIIESGIAIAEIADATRADDIISQLTTARQAAINYQAK
jgi:hypothetical protein